eukprot:SAG11_NODE_638_length_8025_cov_14.591093_4_plen_86_part_00
MGPGFAAVANAANEVDLPPLALTTYVHGIVVELTRMICGTKFSMPWSTVYLPVGIYIRGGDNFVEKIQHVNLDTKFSTLILSSIS